MVFNKMCKSSMRFFSGSMLRNVASDRKSTSFTALDLVTHVCICSFIYKNVIFNSVETKNIILHNIRNFSNSNPNILLDKIT